LLRDDSSVQTAPMMQIRKEETNSPSVEELRNASVLSTWMPGQKTVALEDAGILLPAGSRVGLRIHYHGSGEAHTDQAAVGFYFAKARPRKVLREFGVTNADATISVRAEATPLKLSFTIPADTEAIAIRPRVHPLVTSMQATAYRPDGSQEVM